MISLRLLIPLVGVLGSASLMLCLTIASSANAQAQFDFIEATIPQLQAALSAGTITSRALVAAYLARIEAYTSVGPR
jgi:amidase